MQATNTQLTAFLGAVKQYCIPIFQRPYSWDKPRVERILSDIIAVANDNNRPCHFIGSIIYLPKTQFASQINQCSIIDGQQRLTTLSLILLALADYSRSYYNSTDYSEVETRYEQLSELYLINKFGKGDLRYKLKLCGDDFLAYKELFECETQKEQGNIAKEPSLPDNLKTNRVYTNFLYICKLLKESKIDPICIIKGIGKLLLVDIPLNPEDNAQLVFETVNSTGQPLTEAQKIKNYILMTVSPDDQDVLYKDSWEPMEKGLTPFEFDDFFRYYMTIKMKKQVAYKYYDDFKEYARISTKDTKTIVYEIKRYYDHYLRWKNTEIENNTINKIISNIKATKQLKVTPVILQILDDLKGGKCTEDQAQKVLSVIEAYWMRRAICDMPSNTAGSVCFTMLKNLGKADYFIDFIHAINSLTWAQRMPNDEEMISKLHETPIYGKDFARLLLDRIEAHENKDYSHSHNHSIEHVMPQTIQSHDDLYARTDLTEDQKEKLDWETDLGENWQQIHQKYLNTIGNLTLTGFNTEYKNYRFKYKKEMENGYRQSPIRITSKTIATKDQWGEAEIMERSDAMAKIICDIWKYPQE